MTHHIAHSQDELSEYETAEKDYEKLVRELELLKHDGHATGDAAAELTVRVDKARARFEEVSHSVTGVVGPQTT